MVLEIMLPSNTRMLARRVGACGGDIRGQLLEARSVQFMQSWGKFINPPAWSTC